jgi:hypothetical protein
MRKRLLPWTQSHKKYLIWYLLRRFPFPYISGARGMFSGPRVIFMLPWTINLISSEFPSFCDALKNEIW